MRKLIAIFSLILINFSAFSQKEAITVNIPGLSEENTITKEKLLNIEKIQPEQSDVIIESFTMTTVDSLGYLQDIKLDQNTFTKEAKKWIKETIKAGHKMNFEDIEAKRDDEEISIPPKTIKIVK